MNTKYQTFKSISYRKIRKLKKQKQKKEKRKKEEEEKNKLSGTVCLPERLILYTYLQHEPTLTHT